MIYADTSFLVSLLYEPEKAHTVCMGFYRAHQEHVWLTWEWTLFEARNAFRKLMPEGSERLAAELRMLHSDGPFEHVPDPHWQLILQLAEDLSIKFGGRLPCRPSDMLHLGFAMWRPPDMFVTLDPQQAKLARAAGFIVRLLEHPTPQAAAS